MKMRLSSPCHLVNVSPGAKMSVRREGFTLLEVLMAAFLAVLVLGSVVIIVFHSQLFMEEQMDHFNISMTGRKVMTRLSDDLRVAKPDTVVPILMDASKYVQFQKVVGHTGEGALLSPVTTISLEAAPGEELNGVDDNNDGRVDEAFITYTESGTAPFQIGGNVLGLRFTSLNSGIFIEVEVGLVGRDGNLVRETFSRRVTYRN